MKTIIKQLCLAFCLITSMSAIAQQTSLTVDNQTPGWLSNKINYEDQISVQRLKVTGYLNSDDIAFLETLSTDRSLKVLDLEETHMVTGGSNTGVILEDDVCNWAGIYSNFALQKLTVSKFANLPSIVASSYMVNCNKVDTLVVTYVEKMIEIYRNPKKMLWIPEGVETIYNSGGRINSSINIPASIRKISG